MTAPIVPSEPGGPQTNEGEAPFQFPLDADGVYDWRRYSEMRKPRDPRLEFYRDEQAMLEAEQFRAQAAADIRKAKEAERDKEKVRKGDTSLNGPRELLSRSLGGITMRAIDWLWTGWIPIGYVTLVAGETGAGKSTVLADVKARVTTGAPWPGESPDAVRPPGRVLWLGSEDSVEEMLAPRLVACGADLDRVTVIEGAKQEGQVTTFSMQDDLAAVRAGLEHARSIGHPFTLLVIDPVTSYLPGQKLRKVDLNDAGQLRTVLEPWLKLAQEHRVAIVCVTHFAKDTSRAMLHRVLGSAAFAQTCRSLLAIIERPTPEDEEPEPHAKAMLQVKVNLPEHPGGAWKFSTLKVEVATDPVSGKPITATRPQWEGLDGALTPLSVVGGKRGPVSKYQMPFGIWLAAFFANYPDGEWLRVDVVKQLAIGEGAASESWWDKHSHSFLEKRNEGGTWMCRRKATPYEN